MTFYVGQKVVCVKTGGWSAHTGRDYSGARLPQKGDVCIVADIEDYGLLGRYLALNEFMPAHWSFNAECFRPVVERSTDISIFTEILDRVSGDKPRVREEA